MLRPTRPARRRERALARRILALAAPLALSACMIDSDNKCGPNQHETSEGFVGCQCDEGAILDADKSGCTRCGDNEEVVQGACACKSGFARPAAGAACVASQQGAPCSGSSGCSGEFPYCAPAGYCTKSPCTSDAECAVGGYACEESASPAYCSRPPTGQGKSCSGPADCAGLEASACMGGTCLVSGCKTTTTCHGSSACCDFSAFGMLDVCVPSAGLINGKCPGTMADPVTR